MNVSAMKYISEDTAGAVGLRPITTVCVCVCVQLQNILCNTLKCPNVFENCMFSVGTSQTFEQFH